MCKDVDEKICMYCGLELDKSKEVTERAWREYWKGVIMQPFQYNILKKTKQMKIEEKGDKV